MDLDVRPDFICEMGSSYRLGLFNIEVEKQDVHNLVSE